MNEVTCGVETGGNTIALGGGGAVVAGVVGRRLKILKASGPGSLSGILSIPGDDVTGLADKWCRGDDPRDVTMLGYKPPDVICSPVAALGLMLGMFKTVFGLLEDLLCLGAGCLDAGLVRAGICWEPWDKKLEAPAVGLAGLAAAAAGMRGGGAVIEEVSNKELEIGMDRLVITGMEPAIMGMAIKGMDWETTGEGNMGRGLGLMVAGISGALAAGLSSARGSGF